MVVTTTGPASDPDGYVVRLGSNSGVVGSDGSLLFAEVPPGTHTVELTGLAANCSVVGEAQVSVLVSSGQVAEVTFEVECGLFQEVACTSLTLGMMSGTPLQEISVSGLPTSFDFPVAASISTVRSVDTSFAFVRSDAPDAPENLRLLVPLHPGSPLEGGTVQLSFTDGTRACEPIDFTIHPLPAADGEFVAVVDLLQELVDAQASSFGATRDDLVSTPLDDLPMALWPLAMGQVGLDHPDNERSLRAFAEGDLGSEVVDWLDGLLGQTTVRSELESAVSGSVGLRASPPDRSAPLECAPGVADASAQLLHECMEAAAEARRAAEGTSRQVADDIGTMLSVASENGFPVADLVEQAFSTAFWVIYTQRERGAALYPSEFTGMTLKVSREHFLEDEDGQGSLSTVEVTATNQGYDLQQEIVEAIQQALSVAKTTGAWDVSTGTPADDVSDLLESMVGERLEDKKIEDLQIEPESYGPVDVNDPQWIDTRVAAGESIELFDDLYYRPVLWGPSTISVRTRLDKFGDANIDRQADVEVGTLLVSISPEEIVVQSGDDEDTGAVTFEVTVSESVSPDSLELDEDHPEQGTAIPPVWEGNRVHEVDYVPPTDPDYDEPDLIVVRHTAMAGARAKGPPRTATATIRFASITITGGQPCVEPGETTMAFVAEVEGLDDDDVVWTATAGSMDQNGVFRAPPEAPSGGEVTITATSASEPQVSESVTIDVGLCDICTYDVTISGAFGGSSRGPANFVLSDGGIEIGFDGAFTEGAEGDPVSGGVVTIPWSGDTGTFALDEASFTNQGNGGFAWFRSGSQDLDCSACGGSVTIDEADGQSVTGSFSVVMPTLSPPPPQGEDPLLTSASGSFEAWLHVPGDPFDPYASCVAAWEGG